MALYAAVNEGSCLFTDRFDPPPERAERASTSWTYHALGAGWDDDDFSLRPVLALSAIAWRWFLWITGTVPAMLVPIPCKWVPAHGLASLRQREKNWWFVVCGACVALAWRVRPSWHCVALGLFAFFLYEVVNSRPHESYYQARERRERER